MKLSVCQRQIIAVTLTPRNIKTLFTSIVVTHKLILLYKCYKIINNNNNNTYLYSALFTLCSNALLKKTVIPLLNTHRSYTEKMKVFSRFFSIVMESALWIFRGSSFHNLAAEVPKRRFPNRMDLFLYGTSDVNAVDRKDLLGM